MSQITKMNPLEKKLFVFACNLLADKALLSHVVVEWPEIICKVERKIGYEFTDKEHDAWDNYLSGRLGEYFLEELAKES